MNVIDLENGDRTYTELTPLEHAAGMELLNVEPISYQYSVDDSTWITLTAPVTPEIIATFEAALAPEVPEPIG